MAYEKVILLELIVRLEFLVHLNGSSSFKLKTLKLIRTFYFVLVLLVVFVGDFGISGLSNTCVVVNNGRHNFKLILVFTSYTSKVPS